MKRVVPLALAVLVASCSSATPGAPPSGTASAVVPTIAPSATASAAALPSADPIRTQRFAAPVFVSEQVGWVPTFDDRIFRTTASGWQQISVPRTTFLAGLDFVGTQVGWAIALTGDFLCGAPAVGRALTCRSGLIRTSDGGQTWIEESAFTSQRTLIALHGLRAVSSDSVWAIHTPDCASPASCPDEVLLTEDAARSWRSTLQASRVLDLEAASATEAWAFVSASSAADPGSTPRYEARHTTDGGRTWRTTLTSVNFAAATRTASSLWILERDGGYCTASNCSEYVMRTSTDAGETWRALGNPMRSADCTGGFLGTPSFSHRDLLTGVVPISLGAGGAGFATGGLLETRDGGVSWTCTAVPSNVTAARAVIGIVIAVSSDRTTNTDSVWIRNVSGAWSRVLP